MNIVNHRLEGVAFKPSPNVSGLMSPTGVIMHYTAGFTASSAINTLINPKTKVSAHLVIDRDGVITQLVPFNRVAWHAGPSKLDGRSGCNNFTIGFEFVNPGFFRISRTGELQDWDGHKLPPLTVSAYDASLRAPNAKIGGGNFAWPAYTEEQIEAGLAAFKAICVAYNISSLAGHEDIDTRGWKTDPGPAFPMGLFKDALFGNPSAVADRSDGLSRAATRMLVNTSKLNVRLAPASTAAVLTTLAGGSEVVVLEDLGAWSKVEYAPGKVGYLADQYLKKAA